MLNGLLSTVIDVIVSFLVHLIADPIYSFLNGLLFGTGEDPLA